VGVVTSHCLILEVGHVGAVEYNTGLLSSRILSHHFYSASSVYLALSLALSASLSLSVSPSLALSDFISGFLCCLICLCVSLSLTVKECVNNLSEEDDKEQLVSSLWGAERCLRVLDSVRLSYMFYTLLYDTVKGQYSHTRSHARTHNHNHSGFRNQGFLS